MERTRSRRANLQKGRWHANVPWENPWREYERQKKNLSQNPKTFPTEVLKLVRSLRL